MKAFIISLALVSPAFAEMPETFEVDSKGCVFSTAQATCIFSNIYRWDMRCDLLISAKTKSGVKISKEQKVSIPSLRFHMIEVRSIEQNPIVGATASGVCTIVQ